VRQARPETLLLVADGPRASRPDEAAACEQARAVALAVDWPCKVLTNFSERNLGCRERIASGLDWVFEQVEEAILLEDDCLPDPSFFQFCEEMLQRYRGDERIMAVSAAVTSQAAWSRRPAITSPLSPYLGLGHLAPGLGPLRRKDPGLAEVEELGRPAPALSRLDGSGLLVLEAGQSLPGRVDTWDYQWSLACWMQGGLCVIPAKKPGAEHRF